MEQKKCRHCGVDIEVTDDDLKYLDKISPTFDGKKFQIPPSTLCANCGDQRRFSHINHINLFRRKCDGTGKDIITSYHPDSMYAVYEMHYWPTDAWDPLKYGRDFDFTRSFFEQFHELDKAVPHQALSQEYVHDINSEYTNFAGKNKNCYMIFDSDENEECLYCYGVNGSTNSIDNYRDQKLELCYENIDCFNNYNCQYSFYSDSCTDSAFLYNCTSCTNCLFCVNLRQKENYIFNEKVSRKEFEKMKELLKSYNHVQEYKKKFKELVLQFPHKYMHGVKNENVTGNNIVESKNAHYCFDSMKLWDCKNCFQTFMSLKDSMNISECGEGELLYECVVNGYNAFNNQFSYQCFNQNTNIYYCNMCFRCSDCFGCVGLSRKRFCIFNKQYTEEEYPKIVAKIIEHMVKTKEWGKFFPTKYSAHAYNLSTAYSYYPLTKEEVLAKGWKWQDPDKKEYKPQICEVPDNIDDVKEDIMKEVLACSDCGRNFKIVAQEFIFLKKQGVPVPKKCFNCRHEARIKHRTPKRLWKRTCMCNHSEHEEHRGGNCKNEFETAYAPERKEVVYCEECYLKEVI
ncbi:hypothetical protein ACFLZH_01625 [Patescibacteria group bacterium]